MKSLLTYLRTRPDYVFYVAVFVAFVGASMWTSYNVFPYNDKIANSTPAEFFGTSVLFTLMALLMFTAMFVLPVYMFGDGAKFRLLLRSFYDDDAKWRRRLEKDKRANDAIREARAAEIARDEESVQLVSDFVTVAEKLAQHAGANVFQATLLAQEALATVRREI